MKKNAAIALLLLLPALLFGQAGDSTLDALVRPLPPGSGARVQAERLQNILWYIFIDGNLDYGSYPRQLDSLYHCCLAGKTGDARFEKTVLAQVALFRGAEQTFNNPEAAQPLLRSAFGQFAALGDSTGMALSCMQATFVASGLGDSLAFATYHDQAAGMAQHTKDPFMEALVHCNIGIGCYDFGRFAEAAIHYFKALDLVEQYKTPRLLRLRRDLYHNLNGVYARLGDYDNALIYIRKAIESAESLGQNPWDNYIAMARDYLEKRDYQKALEIFQTAEKNRPDGALPISMAVINYGEATCYRSLGALDTALEHAEQAVRLLPIQTNAHFGAVALEELAACQFALGQTAAALENALTAHRTFDGAKNKGGLVRTAELLASIFKSKGDFRKALEYSDLRYDYQQQIERQQSNRQLAFGEFTRDNAAKTARREAEVKAELDQQRNIRYALFAGLCVLTLLAFLLYNRYRLKRRSAEQLEAKNREVEAARRRAEASEAFKSRFLANMSHEIRTPLHGISGFTDLLLDTALSEKQRRWLGSIQHSSDRLGEVVNDILDLSKLEAGEVRLRRIPFSPARVAADVQEALALRAENKGIVLRLDVAGDVPLAVLGDPTRLYQILMNLTGNAVKFTEKGSVTLSVGRTGTGNALSFSVADTGIGIPPEKLSSIFDSFQQAGEDTTARFGGTGLGLTIARELVQLHGSDIRVDSKPGEGSRFTFDLALPLADAGDLEQDPAKDDALFFNQPLRILLADDNALNREIATEAIFRHFENAEITEAATGKEAVALAQNSRFDLILMDMQMPEMSGMEATRHLRIDLATAIPIIALTASATPEEIEHALASGMNRHLGKPFKPRELAQVIADTLNLHPSGPALRKIEPAEKTETREAAEFDLDYLRDFCDGDEAQVRHFVQRFLEQYPVEIGRLQAALKEEDRDSVCRIAHGFRPQLEFVGLKEAAALLLDLERRSRSGASVEHLSGLAQQVADWLKIAHENCLAWS